MPKSCPMPLFQYKGLQADGVLAEGQLEAAGRQEAFRHIEGLGLRPVSLAEREGAEPGSGPGISIPLKWPFGKGSQKISARALENFTRLLSSLLAAGVPLSRALTI